MLLAFMPPIMARPAPPVDGCFSAGIGRHFVTGTGGLPRISQSLPGGPEIITPDSLRISEIITPENFRLAKWSRLVVNNFHDFGNRCVTGGSSVVFLPEARWPAGAVPGFPATPAVTLAATLAMTLAGALR